MIIVRVKKCTVILPRAINTSFTLLAHTTSQTATKNIYADLPTFTHVSCYEPSENGEMQRVKQVSEARKKNDHDHHHIFFDHCCEWVEAVKKCNVFRCILEWSGRGVSEWVAFLARVFGTVRSTRGQVPLCNEMKYHHDHHHHPHHLPCLVFFFVWSYLMIMILEKKCASYAIAVRCAYCMLLFSLMMTCCSRKKISMRKAYVKGEKTRELEKINWWVSERRREVQCPSLT